MLIRERIQEWEKQSLSEYAMLSSQTRGRKYPTEECPVRTPFQRDRDRIIHCKSFRRLMHKTQVFISPQGDHYRTRLTHTLEVSQIARTISRALMLNEDLTEAISLGHDLGHTPFGHAGETGLNEISPAGYRHYLQSVRVAEKLENNGQGLNLTYEVLNGIKSHSHGTPPADTLEGRVVRFADKIAYMNHDIEDAVRASILKESDIPASIQDILGKTKSQRITTFVTSIISHSGADIAMEPSVQQAYDDLRSFLRERVYKHPVVESEEKKGTAVVKRLYEYFYSEPDRLPEEYQKIAEEEGVDRAVCDYISGMSDRYAISVYESVYVPRSWESFSY